MKNYIILVIMIACLSFSCNEYKPTCTSYRNCIANVFYSDIAINKKINLIKQMDRLSIQDTIDFVAIHSLLETIKGSKQLSHADLIKAPRLYEYARKDSLDGFNMVFLSYVTLGSNYYIPMQSSAEYILTDKSFLTTTHSYIGSSEIFLPLDTVINP